MDKLTNKQKEQLNKPIGKHIGGKPRKMRIRSKEEILRQIEWADSRSGELEENIRVSRRAICEGCGTLFDKYWNSKGISDYCTMCI